MKIELSATTSPSEALLDAITRITVLDGVAAAKAVNQLEFASGVILRGKIDREHAGAMKVSFMQKIGQVDLLGLPEFLHIAEAPWVRNTCIKLDTDAHARSHGYDQAGAVPHVGVLAGSASTTNLKPDRVGLHG